MDLAMMGLPHLFEGPANARVARQSLAAIRRPFEGREGGLHGNLIDAGWAGR